MYERLAASRPEDSYLRNLFQGSAFNWENYHRYDYREVYLEKLIDPGPPPVTQNFRVDSYTSGEGVVSRKMSQLSEIQPRTALAYIDEVVRKLNSGNSDIRIAGMPGNASQFGDRSGAIVDRALRGPMILEIPVRHAPVPTEVLAHARRWDVILRDVTDTHYTLP